MDIKVGYRYYEQWGMSNWPSHRKYYFTIVSIKKDNVKVKLDNPEDKERMSIPTFKCNFIELLKDGNILEDKEYNRTLKRNQIINDIL